MKFISAIIFLTVNNIFTPCFSDDDYELQSSQSASNKPLSKAEQREYDKYNKKYMDGYLKMMKDVEDDEDRSLKAYDAGEQPPARPDFQSFMSNIPVLRNMLGKTCFRDIGCFSALDFQDFVDRPISVLPMTPDYINPDFLLYTKNNLKKPISFKYNATAEELTGSPFNPKYRTVVIVHGFRSGLEPWMEAIKDMLFSREHNDYNVVCVDWNRGAKVPSYSFAAANTRVVGALTAFFIDRIVTTFTTSNEDFYLVGHSLGAHAVGYTGARLYSPKVSRITGLDPAGPAFYKNDPKQRLDPTDAQEVDIIHTDMAASLKDGLGLMDAIGDYDFYPNGGRAQPGCPATIGVKGFVKAAVANEDISCSHTRAHDLAKALGNPRAHCLPVGYQCPNYESFLEGRCADCGTDESKCQLMGLYPNYWIDQNFTRKNTPNKFYLNTAMTREYCIYHYQIAFHVSDTSTSATGRFSITLASSLNGGQRNFTIKRLLSRTEPGRIHTMLVTFPFNMKIGPIIRLTLDWKGSLVKRKDSVEEATFEVDFVEINFLSHIKLRVRNKKSIVMCPESINKLEIDGTGISFVLCPIDNRPTKLAKSLEPNQLKPMTRAEDINSVDFASLDRNKANKN